VKHTGFSLRAEGVTVTVAGKSLLKNVSVAVQPGRLTVLLGCNGAGKSTLLRALAGISSPSSGIVTLDETPLRQIPPEARAKTVAYLPQSLNAPFAFTVDELIHLNANKTTHPPVCEMLEIEELRGRALTGLSGGERQRAALARVLSGPARTLLLDEPTAHLDLRHTLRLLHRLRERTQLGEAILVATHDLPLCLPFADHVLILTDGRRTFDDSKGRLTPEILETCLGIETALLPANALSGYLKLT
jgi:iron complex transport system ATP-binding protein